MTQDQHTVPEKDRVPLKQKIAYGFGLSADHYAQFGISSLALPFFNILLGISPAIVTTALAVSRAWDAITDPVVGSISDNLKNPKGRRKPLLFWGAILTGSFFPIVWMAPQQWSENAIFLYLLVVFPLFYTCYSAMSVPYESLGMELTPNYRERTSLYTVRIYINTFLTLPIFFLFYFANSPVFSDPIMGVRVVSLGVGAYILIAGVYCAKICEERYHTVARKQRRENLLRTTRSLFKNTPMVIIAGSVGIFLFAITSVQAMDPYVHIYYIYGGDKAAGALLDGINRTLPLVFSLLGVFCVNRLSNRYDKHHLLLISVVILFFAKLGLYVTYYPGRVWLTLTTKPFYNFSTAAFWVLVISMRADVADWDEYCFGRRREGVIAAVNTWLAKVAITLAVASSGYLLQFAAGFDVKEAQQSIETLERIKLLYVAIPTVALVIVFIMLLRYPLSRKKMEEIRATLEERREAV